MAFDNLNAVSESFYGGGPSSCVWAWPSPCGATPWGLYWGPLWHSLAPNQIFLWYFWEGVACCVEGENLGPAPSADQLRPGLGSVSLPRGLSWVASRQRVLPAPALGHPSCTKDAPLSPCLGGWALLAARVFSSLLS